MKKILLVIVEGETDMISLEGVFENIFSNSTVEFEIIRGDLQLIAGSGKNIVQGIRNMVESFMKLYYLQKENILRIVHIIDTDGAFIPAEKVERGSQGHVKYLSNRILAPNPEQIVRRNASKTEFVKTLVKTEDIEGIPYGIYYFSRNLEHVLHNRDDIVQNRTKCRLAYDFSDRYSRDPEGFLTFIRNESVAVNQGYIGSWAFIFSRCNSLKRYSNLHVVFEDMS